MLVWKKENWTIKRRYVREGVHEGEKKKEILGHPEMSEQLLRITAVKGKEIVWPRVLGLSGTHLDFFLSQKLSVVSLCLCFNWALWAYPEIKFRLWTCLFLLNATCVSLHELFFLLLLCVKPVRISFFFFFNPYFWKNASLIWLLSVLWIVLNAFTLSLFLSCFQLLSICLKWWY